MKERKTILQQLEKLITEIKNMQENKHQESVNEFNEMHENYVKSVRKWDLLPKGMSPNYAIAMISIGQLLKEQDFESIEMFLENIQIVNTLCKLNKSLESLDSE